MSQTRTNTPPSTRPTGRHRARAEGHGESEEATQAEKGSGTVASRRQAQGYRGWRETRARARVAANAPPTAATPGGPAQPDQTARGSGGAARGAGATEQDPGRAECRHGRADWNMAQTAATALDLTPGTYNLPIVLRNLMPACLVIGPAS